MYRNLLRERGLAELARRNAIPDPYFAHEFAEITPLRRHIVIAGAIAGGAIAGGAIALIAIGTRLFGWHF